MKTLIVVTCALLSGLPVLAQSPHSITCKSALPSKTDADAAYAAERFPEAERLFAQQVSTAPTEAAWSGLVHSQIQRNEVAEALATAKRAVAALPKSAQAEVLLGDAELRAGHLEEASAAYHQAQAMDFCSAGAHFGNGRLLLLASMRGSALKEFALAHRLALANSEISETVFAMLPPAMHAKGLRNLLASATDLAPAHRQHLEQEASLLEMGATCHPPEMLTSTVVPLTPVFLNGTQIRDYSLRVTSGSSSPLNLELDSTASGIVLTEVDAKKLNVTPAVASQTTAPYLGYLESVQIGPLHYGKCAVSVVPNADLGRRYSVIGTSFFHDSLIHLDWVAKQMTLRPYEGPSSVASEAVPTDALIPAAEKDWVHAIIDDGRVLVPATVEKHPVGLVMLGTSFTLSMISPFAAEAASFKPGADDTLDVEGISGSLVRIFRKEGGGNMDQSDLKTPAGKNIPVNLVGERMTVVFAANQPPDFAVYSFDNTPSSHAAGLEIGGMIGYAALRQYFIDFDYRNGLVNLKYDIGFPLRESTLESR